MAQNKNECTRQAAILLLGAATLSLMSLTAYCNHEHELHCRNLHQSGTALQSCLSQHSVLLLVVEGAVGVLSMGYVNTIFGTPNQHQRVR